MSGPQPKAWSSQIRWPLLGGASLLAVPVLVVWLISDPRMAGLAGNTLWLVLTSCAISVPVGAGLAFLLVRTDLPGRTLLLGALMAMLLVPLYLQAAAWDAGFGRAGWLAFSQETMQQPLLRGWNAVIWIHGMAAIPWVVMLVGLSLRYVERTWEEAALLDGTAWQVALHITLRQSLAAVGVAGLWVALSTSGEMTVTDLYGVRTYAEEVYIGTALGDDLAESWGTICPAFPLVLLLVVMSLTFLARVTPADVVPRLQPLRPFRLGAARWPMLLLVLAMVLLVIGVPLGNLIYKAGLVVNEFQGERARVWSSWHFGMILYQSLGEFKAEIAWSLAVGGASASLVLASGGVLAWIASRGGARSVLVLALCAVCLALPGPQVGLLTIRLLNHSELGLTWLYDNTILAPVLALSVKSLPLATLILWYAFHSLPRELFDNARLEGLGWIDQMVWLVIPQRLGAITIAWLVGLVIAMGDVSASILAVPPGVELAPIRVFGLVHYGVEDRLAGLCLLLVGLFAALGLIFLLLWRVTLSRGESD